MKTRRYFVNIRFALVSAVLAMLLLIACQPTPQQSAPAAPESKAVATKDVYLVFEGPWAFAPDPKDPNSVIALAPKTKIHRDLTVHNGHNVLAPGVYDLSLPAHSGSAAGTIDPNILQAQIDPQSVQHALGAKGERYAIRIPKPEAYLPATHYRSRAGSAYPPDASTEKDYATAISLRYAVTTLNGFSLAGSPDSGTFNPLLLQVETPIVTFAIDPAHDRDPADKCHLHERETFRQLTKLVNLTLFLDFAQDPAACHSTDPQNSRPVKAEIAPNATSLWARAFAGGPRQHLAAAIYFFGAHVSDCGSPPIVGTP